MRCKTLLKYLAGALLVGTLGGCLDPNGLPFDPLGGVDSGEGFTRVVTNIDPSKVQVTAGETLTLSVSTNLTSGTTYSWSAPAGRLSSTSGQTVGWTAGGSGRVIITCRLTNGSNSTSAQFAFVVR